MYCMVPPNHTAPDSQAYYRSIGGSYVQAIKQSGVKRVVHLSSWGAHLSEGTGFIVGSYDVEQLLNTLSDVALTHLRAGYIYYNLYVYVNMIKKAGIIGNNYGGDDRIAMVSPFDIAVAAAEELTRSATSHDVRYVVSEEYTANEAARILGAAIGKPDLQWITFSNEQTQSGLEQNGVPTYIATNLVDLGASIHDGRLGEDYERHKPSMGKIKLDDFAKEFAAAYNRD